MSDTSAATAAVAVAVDVRQLEKETTDTPETDAVLPAIVYPVILLLRQGAGSIFAAFVVCGFLRGTCGVSNRVVLIVAMLQGAGPPMINLSVMAGLSGSAEMETSKLLLFTY